jgi:hypothetical protein
VSAWHFTVLSTPQKNTLYFRQTALLVCSITHEWPTVFLARKCIFPYTYLITKNTVSYINSLPTVASKYTINCWPFAAKL